jgi:hypothetical protein
MRGLPAQPEGFGLWLACLVGFLSLATALRATPVFTVAPSGHDGFDVYADGVLAAPMRLAAFNRSGALTLLPFGGPTLNQEE